MILNKILSADHANNFTAGPLDEFTIFFRLQGARVWVKDAVNVWKSATVTKDYDGGSALSVEGDEDAEQG